VTPAAELLQPESNPALYVCSVLTLYVDLPELLCERVLRINGSPVASMKTGYRCM
jgi:hypothetical protein